MELFLGKGIHTFRKHSTRNEARVVSVDSDLYAKIVGVISSLI